jgi:Tfp pilus assembly protein PilO
MKSSTKRFTSSLLALVLLVAALIVYFEMVQPAYGNLEAAKGKLAGEGQMLQNEANTVGQVQKLITAYEGQASAEAALAAALPTGKPDLAGAIAQIYGLAQANSLTIGNLGVSVSTPIGAAAQAVGAAGSSVPVSPLGTVAFSLTANGSYENFLNFISGLESNLRLFDIRQVSVQPAGAVGKSAVQDYFTYTVTVNVYYQPVASGSNQ